MTPQDEQRDVAGAERDMEKTEREMEHEGEHLEDDIEETRRDLEELRRVQGEAGTDFAGDWRETGDEAGGEDPSGAESSVDVERD